MKPFRRLWLNKPVRSAPAPVSPLAKLEAAQLAAWCERAWRAEDTVRRLTGELTEAKQLSWLFQQMYFQAKAEAREARDRARALACQLSPATLKHDRSCRVCKDLMPWGTQHVCRGLATTAGEVAR